MSDTSKGKAGTLYLVPAPLDFGCESQTALTEVLPEGTLRRAASLTHWVSENAKTARAYLKRIDALFPLAAPLQAQNIAELPREAHKKGDHGNKGGAVFDPKPLLAPALAGQDMGLISEAGMPAVADPGSSIVRAAHDLGIRVVPLTGPVSLLLGLVVLYLALANPHVSVAMLGWGIGFYALVTGVTLLILAMRLRRRVQSFKA